MFLRLAGAIINGELVIPHDNMHATIALWANDHGVEPDEFVPVEICLDKGMAAAVYLDGISPRDTDNLTVVEFKARYEVELEALRDIAESCIPAIARWCDDHIRAHELALAGRKDRADVLRRTADDRLARAVRACADEWGVRVV